MKHFLIKFNHGVEIGAHLAYVGHYKRTGDKQIRLIASEEVSHMVELERILEDLGERPNKYIDETFRFIGNTIRRLCSFCPLWSLNFVASTMEMFAIFNYNRLAYNYPQFRGEFEKMAKTEKEHEKYFSTVSK